MTLDKRYINTALAVSVAIILFPLGYSVVAFALSLGTADSEPFLERAGEEPGAKCILETTCGYHPRFQHMVYLKDARVSAVREGTRKDVGLNDCWKCHSNRERGTSRERFCDRCHQRVNLHLDCFRCHASEYVPPEDSDY